MGILGNIAKNTAKEYTELLCKGVAGLGLMAFSQVTYTVITGTRKAAKEGFTKAVEACEKIPTAEERKAMKEEKEKEAKLERQKAIREDMLRRQKESVLNGGR